MNQLKSSLKTPNKFKTDPDSYVRYEIAKQAIQKYSELLYQQKDQVLIKYRRSGEKYESETKKLIKVNELLQNEFPNAQKYQEQLSKYSQDIEVISKKHRYDKPGIYEKHATLYKKYEKEIKESVEFAEVEKAKKIVVNIDSISVCIVSCPNSSSWVINTNINCTDTFPRIRNFEWFTLNCVIRYIIYQTTS